MEIASVGRGFGGFGGGGGLDRFADRPRTGECGVFPLRQALRVRMTGRNRQRRRKKQIPCGNDRKKGKGTRMDMGDISGCTD